MIETPQGLACLTITVHKFFGKDFDIDKYLNFWKNIDKRNYKEFSNIHPFIKNAWKKLDYCEGKTIDEVIRNLSHKEISVSKPNLIINNIIQFLKYKFK